MDAQGSLTDDTVFPIPLGIMQPGTLAPVNLYIQVRAAARYVLYKQARALLREEIRQRLLANGVTTLYLRKKDERAYHDYVEQNINAIIKDDLLPTDQACRVVYDTSTRVMEEVFEEPHSGRNMERAHTMVEATVLSILKNPEALWHMTAMASHDYYTYTHCVHVSMFLVAATRDMLGVTDQKVLERIGLGGIFHDIGKSQIPEAILAKPGRLTYEEFERVKTHPLVGLDIVRRDRKMSPTSAHIIRGHHEHFDGTGYPAGLAGEGINEFARLATVIDVYDAVTTKRCYADARDPYHALDMMLRDMTEQFDASMLRSFVKFLGPKESRVELRARWDSEVARALSRAASGPLQVGGTVS